MSKQVVTSVTQSRGENANAYIPAFKKGAQVMSGNIGALFLSGTIVSGKKVMPVTHGIGVKPKMIVVCAINTLTQASAAQNASVSLAAASAATSSTFYIIGSGTQNAAQKYAAYVQF